MQINDEKNDVPDTNFIPWSEKENERLRDEQKLKKYNIIACVLHLIQAIALLILGNPIYKTISTFAILKIQIFRLNILIYRDSC